MHKMICGSFSESVNRRLELAEVDKNMFCRLLDIWCGKEDSDEENVWETLELGSIADRFQMTEVRTALEEKILEQLNLGTCTEILTRSSSLGLVRVEEAARLFVTDNFEEVAKGEELMQLNEDVFSRILEEDGLRVRQEEDVFEAAVSWMQGGADGLRGQQLLRTVRFGLIGKRFLLTRARQVFGREHREFIEPYILESLRLKSRGIGRVDIQLEHLGPKALLRRSGPEIRWEAYANDRLPITLDTGGTVYSVGECAGRLLTGLEDGTIAVMDGICLELERTLRVERKPGAEYIFTLSDWGERVFSGHWNGVIVAWDVRTGDRVCVLDGHSDSVSALAASDSRLVSGSSDGSIKAWSMAGEESWLCEWDVAGHGMSVGALAIWERNVISGSEDETIRVWDLGTGALESILRGHQAGVRALLVNRAQLFSASRDGTIREWQLGTWAAMRAVAACDEAGGQWPCCLAMSGSRLVSGTACGRQAAESRCRVQVWDLATLTCEYSLLQAEGLCVQCLAAAPGEIWGVVGGAVVVWGRE